MAASFARKGDIENLGRKLPELKELKASAEFGRPDNMSKMDESIRVDDSRGFMDLRRPGDSSLAAVAA